MLEVPRSCVTADVSGLVRLRSSDSLRDRWTDQPSTPRQPTGPPPQPTAVTADQLGAGEEQVHLPSALRLRSRVAKGARRELRARHRLAKVLHLEASVRLLAARTRVLEARAHRRAVQGDRAERRAAVEEARTRLEQAEEAAETRRILQFKNRAVLLHCYLVLSNKLTTRVWDTLVSHYRVAWARTGNQGAAGRFRSL